MRLRLLSTFSFFVFCAYAVSSTHVVMSVSVDCSLLISFHT